MDSLTSTGSPLLTLKGKPKRTKPRKAVREFNFRIGRYQFELTIWKFRNNVAPS